MREVFELPLACDRPANSTGRIDSYYVVQVIGELKGGGAQQSRGEAVGGSPVVL